MRNPQIAIASVYVKASPERVWKALTNPEEIKEYLFGTKTTSDWKKGSSITYSGEWQGTSYVDKGEIIDIAPPFLLHTTYLSSMSGREDKPENYMHVIYKVIPADNGCILTIVQDNNTDDKSREHSESNWEMVLGSLKKLVEGPGKNSE
jgi:uncharacterized protein YndB with AHSA1/START domain